MCIRDHQSLGTETTRKIGDITGTSVEKEPVEKEPLEPNRRTNDGNNFNQRVP